MAKRVTLKDPQREINLFVRRLVLAAIFVLACSAVLIGRLFYLQIAQHDLYTTLSLQNQFELIPIEPNRGLIYDRNGVLIAENIPIFSLDLIPNHIKNVNAIITSLQGIINITPEDIRAFRKAIGQHRPFELIPLKMKLTEEEVAKFYLNQYRFPGATISARLLRNYPFGDTLSSVLGYVGRISDQDLKTIDTTNYSASNYIGKTGAEKTFESELHGTVGYQQVEMDASGHIVRTLKRIAPTSGDNLYLSIDSSLQIAAEQALGDNDGTVIAIQPRTGEVLAMVSKPSYDPNPFVRGITVDEFKALQTNPDRPLYNRAIRGQFPIGSTIKPYMALEGLASGAIDTNYTISDPGWFKLPNSAHIYHDWVKHGHGRVNVLKAIIVSCDTFFYGVAVKVGIDGIDKILDDFGFGEKTGVDPSEEMPGLVPSPAWKRKKFGVPWFPGDTVVAGIGQGYILATPLQMVQGVATIANRGNHYKLTLLHQVEKPDNTVLLQQPAPGYPVVFPNQQIWDTVINGMIGVIKSIDPSGTGGHVFGRDAPYSVAAKTGTVQVFRSGGDKIDQSTLPKKLRNHSMFIAFAPVENPQIAIAVMVEHGTNAGVVARKVMDFYLLTDKHWDH
jgi:penicillin-binding protein 2